MFSDTDRKAIYKAAMEQIDSLETPLQNIWAKSQCEAIKKYIEDFEDSLDDEHEVCIMFTNYGQPIGMSVTDIVFEGPVLMVFKGFVDGREATSIQHINQLNFLLKAVEKDPDRQKKPIGFQIGK